MAETTGITRIAVQVVGVSMPGNWDRPLGYTGNKRYVAVYWDCSVDDVYITDGLVGRSGGAWWLYANLVDHDARQQISATLMACGVSDPLNNWPLGGHETYATHGLILDRFEHSLWVAQLSNISRSLSLQHLSSGEDIGTITMSLIREKDALYKDLVIRPNIPCDCARGWVLLSDYYMPCPRCQRSGKIEVIPEVVTF